jgi:hypothetical protein
MWPEKEEVQRFLDEGIARARQMADKALEISVLTAKGLRAAMHGQPYTGSQMIVEAERMAMKTGDPRSILIARHYRAIIERWLGRPDKFLELTEGMLQTRRDMWNLIPLAYLSYHSGVALAEIGRSEEGIVTIKDGIDMCEKFGIVLVLGSLYNAVGYCYGEIHHPERASQFNLRGEQIARGLIKQDYVGGRMLGSNEVL